MAWGLWNKIKTGLTKAGRFIKNAAGTVVDKVIKPFKPVITAAATAFNPAFGAVASKVMDEAERFSDEGWRETGNRAIGWANNKLKRG